MVEISKPVSNKDLSWTLRLEPNGSRLVQEATVSVPLSENHSLYGGVIPDFQGYEASWANSNPLITHNALFDMAGPATYEGMGMSSKLSDDVSLKWMVGHIDGSTNDALGLSRNVGMAYRFDWTINDAATLGFSGAHSHAQREFNVLAVDGGYTIDKWSMNGQ